MFTAFITFMGIFEFLRVPMGMKGAAPYFQQFIAVTVLAGLIYHVAEAYIDDVIIHGKTENEFIENLRKVFIRFRKYNVKLQPTKMHLGMSRIEFVGHTIDKEGLHFTQRIGFCLEFPKACISCTIEIIFGISELFS